MLPSPSALTINSIAPFAYVGVRFIVNGVTEYTQATGNIVKDCSAKWHPNARVVAEISVSELNVKYCGIFRVVHLFHISRSVPTYVTAKENIALLTNLTSLFT